MSNRARQRIARLVETGRMKQRRANRLLRALEGLERDPLPPGREVRALFKRSSFRMPLLVTLEALLLAGGITQKDHRRVLFGVCANLALGFAAVLFACGLFHAWLRRTGSMLETGKSVALGAALAFWGGVVIGLLIYALGRWEAARCAKLLRSLEEDKPIEPPPRLPSGLPPR